MFRRTPTRPLRPTVGNTVGLTTRFSSSNPMHSESLEVEDRGKGYGAEANYPKTG